MQTIKPGQTVEIEVTSLPRSEAARKTLIRILKRDPEAIRRQRHQKNKRPSREEWIRGAMTWHHQMKSRPPVDMKVGAKGTLRATLDVLRDLTSVSRFVKITGR